jgi:hypothetical protein
MFVMSEKQIEQGQINWIGQQNEWRRTTVIEELANLIVDGIEAMSGVTDRSRDLLIRSGQYGRVVRVQTSPLGSRGSVGGCNFHGCN